MRHTDREVLEDDLVRLRYEGSAFELTTSHDLRLDDSFLLPDPCLIHVLLLEYGQLGVILLHFESG